MTPNCPLILGSRERSSSKQLVSFIFQISRSTTLLCGNRETMTITRMGPILYNAAAKGNIVAFKDDNFKRPLEALLTPNKNTVLHIFITTLKNQIESTENNFVRDILNMCPSLLCQVNVKDETPLHIAARVKAVRDMLRMVTKEKDTALHEAVRYNHLEVIKLLIKEDPDFSYSINDAGETPLYIAVERDYENLVLEILNTCNSLAYDGPLGRTALHAAVFRDNTVTITEILKRIGGDITKRVDQEGWTPLHLTAYSDGWLSTELLLEHDSEVAYIKDKKGRTALHIAAHRGNILVMKSIIDMCPDCCELVDNRGWNALHFAVEGDRPDSTESTVELILENSSLSNLLNEKDSEGNTPLHHISLSSGPYLKDLIDHPRVDKMAFNKNNLNAYQVALSAKLSTGKMMEIGLKFWSYSGRVLTEDEDKLKKIIQDDVKDMENKRKASMKVYMEKAAETHLLVAALITTVTLQQL
ncbi:ankyrin repeat-containing protein At5g02620-like isoform X2 [Juglans microcarpa x Juglans regia]|uniref:ankyrin repeat-containing protein At5g02620-like isoform X2 n=1 Tax=Juglans microcarpa x Juglans regia TaxID=2249226 RepID=UPI001B7E285C|nr:ankyrin repeat-containing protein At5g02620-like isoform X2 [Juglans microcarpa x Juglans regia]